MTTSTSTAPTTSQTTLPSTTGLSPIARLYAGTPGSARVIEAAQTRLQFVDVAVSAGARSLLTAVLAARESHDVTPILLVTATTRVADDLAEALGCLVGPDFVGTFPQLGDAALRAAQPAVTPPAAAWPS